MVDEMGGVDESDHPGRTVHRSRSSGRRSVRILDRTGERVLPKTPAGANTAGHTATGDGIGAPRAGLFAAGLQFRA
jgi:hypothetical protein